MFTGVGAFLLICPAKDVHEYEYKKKGTSDSELLKNIKSGEF